MIAVFISSITKIAIKIEHTAYAFAYNVINFYLFLW